MIKKYNFENSANKKLMAEILTHRDRHPRSLFLSSLAAVMVAAISLTMVFGSLSTSALPIEQPEQQTVVNSVTGGDTLPPEVVTRVHTETQTETVTLYNDSPQLSETLLVSDTASAEPSLTENALAADTEPAADKMPAAGKSLFDQKQQRFQWQYGDEIFTFFVKDNTVWRRSEKTDDWSKIYCGNGDTKLFCLNDRYLFFGVEAFVECDTFLSKSIYCYRADLLTGEILRLFNYIQLYDQPDYEAFVRFNGTDVIFTHYIVHEDGNYERIPDTPEQDVIYNPRPHSSSLDTISLYLNDDNTISVEDLHGNIYDLGIRVDYIESLGYSFDEYFSSWIMSNESGEEFILVRFYPAQTGMNATLSYYGKITDQGLKGGLIKIGISNLPDMSYNTEFVSNDIYVFYNYDNNHFSIPIDFDKLAAAVTPVPESYSSDDGEAEAIITYYPINSLHDATPDSAD